VVAVFVANEQTDSLADVAVCQCVRVTCCLCCIAERGLWTNMPEGRELQPRYHGEHAVRGAKQHPSDRGRFEYGLSIHFQR